MKEMIMNLAPVRNWRWMKAVKDFLAENEVQGIRLRDREVPRALAGIKTIVVSQAMVMEGWNGVRMVTAPLIPCNLEKFRRQGSWMMLTAGVALGCEGYEPLESFAREFNFERERMAQQYPLVSALSYDPDRRMETTVHRDAGGLRAYTKGAPEAVLSRCSHLLDGRERPLTPGDRAQIMDAILEIEAHGLMSLGFATKWQGEAGPYEEGMVFLGIVGMGDMAKQEIPSLFQGFHRMGIKPVLLSEDSLSLGAVQASGLVAPGREALLYRGQELQAMEEPAFLRAVGHANALVSIPAAMEGPVLRALQSGGGTATLTPLRGGLSLSLGHGEGPEAFLPGGLASVAPLLGACRALVDAFTPR